MTYKDRVPHAHKSCLSVHFAPLASGLLWKGEK